MTAETSSLHELLDLRRSGMTAALIARRLGITPVAAHRRLERAGIPMTAAVPPRAAVRTCVCCRTAFVSTGPHNRICDPCRGFVHD